MSKATINNPKPVPKVQALVNKLGNVVGSVSCGGEQEYLIAGVVFRSERAPDKGQWGTKEYNYLIPKHSTASSYYYYVVVSGVIKQVKLRRVISRPMKPGEMYKAVVCGSTPSGVPLNEDAAWACHVTYTECLRGEKFETFRKEMSRRSEEIIAKLEDKEAADEWIVGAYDTVARALQLKFYEKFLLNSAPFDDATMGMARSIQLFDERPRHSSPLLNDMENLQAMGRLFHSTNSNLPRDITKDNHPISNKLIIATQTLVNGVPLDAYSDAQLVELIRRAEGDIKNLESIQNKPRTVTRQIEDLHKGIKDLVAVLNERDAKANPEPKAAE